MRGTYACTYMHACVPMHVHLCMCTCACAPVHVYLCACVPVRVYLLRMHVHLCMSRSFSCAATMNFAARLGVMASKRWATLTTADLPLLSMTFSHLLPPCRTFSHLLPPSLRCATLIHMDRLMEALSDLVHMHLLMALWTSSGVRRLSIWAGPL